MKKYLALLIALTLTLLLIAAPATAEDATSDAAEPTVEATDETEPVEESADEESEGSEEEEETWAESHLGDLLGMNWYTMVILVALLALGIAICAKKRSAWTARRIAYAAMCIAIAFVLSCIKLFRMPQGGSVTPEAMLPLILFALACGPVQGMVVGFAFSLLQLIEDFYVIHPIQLLVDYPMAYGALALGCLAMLIPADNKVRLPIAVLLGYLGRYLMATISGAVFFAEYAGDQNAWIYSLGYNLSYMGPEALIACIVSCIPAFAKIVEIMRKKV